MTDIYAGKDAEITKLRAELAAALDSHDAWATSWHAKLEATEAALTACRAESAGAVAALKPFAKAAGIIEWTTKATGRVFRDDEPFQSGLAWRETDGSTGTITYGDVRRARAALQPSEPDGIGGGV